VRDLAAEVMEMEVHFKVQTHPQHRKRKQ